MVVRAAAVIPGAGEGRRLGGVRKAFVELGGQPLLRRTLAAVMAEPRIVRIIVALDAQSAADPPEWLGTLDKRVRVVAGGAERSDSVRAALAHVDEDVDVVLVHDAARPFVSAELLGRALDAAARGRCVVAAVPATDTIQEVGDDGVVVRTPDRRRLWHAQTPQAFPRSILVEAYARAARQGIVATDDAALVVDCGIPVHIVEGEPANIKITTPLDLALAEFMLSRA